MSLRPHQTVLASAGFSVIWLIGFRASFQCRNHGTAAEHPTKQDATETALGDSFQPPHWAGGPAAEAWSHGVPRLCPLNSNSQSKGSSLVLSRCMSFQADISISSVLVLSMLGGQFSKVWEKGMAANGRSMRAGLSRPGFDTWVYHERTHTSASQMHRQEVAVLCVILLSVL